MSYSAGARAARNKTSKRAVAAARYVSTSQPKALGPFLHFPTTGVIIMIVMFWMFILSKYALTMPRTRQIFFRLHPSVCLAHHA